MLSLHKLESAARAPSLRCPDWGSRRGGCGDGARLSQPAATATGTSFRDLLRRVAGTAHTHAPTASWFTVAAPAVHAPDELIAVPPSLRRMSSAPTMRLPGLEAFRLPLPGLIPPGPCPSRPTRRLDILTFLRFKLRLCCLHSSSGITRETRMPDDDKLPRPLSARWRRVLNAFRAGESQEAIEDAVRSHGLAQRASRTVA
jgi:hypothetical protein